MSEPSEPLLIYAMVIDRIKKDNPGFRDGGLLVEDGWIAWYDLATDEELEAIRAERETLGLNG